MFRYCNETGSKFSTLNFNEFCDPHGNLRDDMGKYHNPSDPIHLGSNGIKAFVKLVRQRVYNNTTTSILYSDVIRGSVSRESTIHEAAQPGHPSTAAP